MNCPSINNMIDNQILKVFDLPFTFYIYISKLVNEAIKSIRVFFSRFLCLNTECPKKNNFLLFLSN